MASGAGGSSGIVAAAVALTLMALAAAPASAGRPLATEDAGTLEPGQVEVELGVDYIRDAGVATFLLPGGPTLNAGLLPRLEASAGSAFALLDPDDEPLRAGLADTVLRLKYRLLDESASTPALALAAAARLPTGDRDRGFGEEGADVQPLVIASKTFGPATLTLNAGYLFATRDRDLDTVAVSAAAEVVVGRAWTLVGEVVSELATTGRGDDRVVVRGGAVHALHERARLDAAVGVGATRAGPDLLLTLGVTILFR